MTTDGRSHTGDLLESARGGDRASIAALCARFRDPLVRFCYRYLGTADRAEDAAQDVLARVAVEARWPNSSFRAWLYRVARNHCLNQRRQQRHEVDDATILRETGLVSPHTGPHTAADRSERQEALELALAAMPPALAEPLILRYFQDLNRREMAEVLDVSEGVVKERLVRARRELARKLDGEVLS